MFFNLERLAVEETSVEGLNGVLGHVGGAESGKAKTLALRGIRIKSNGVNKVSEQRRRATTNDQCALALRGNRIESNKWSNRIESDECVKVTIRQRLICSAEGPPVDQLTRF